MTRARDIADQQDNLGGAVAPWVAGKNAVINGGMDIWQRGTSFAGTTLAGAYSADRWGFYRGGAIGGATWTRQSSGLTGFQYSLRAQRNSGDTSTQYVAIWQAVETINAVPFAGKIATISFWAKCGANYSAASSALSVFVSSGTGTDEPPYSFTGATNPIAQSATITTSWQRFSFTGTFPSNTNEISIQFVGYPTGTAGANDWFEVTGIQLEQGSVATPFARAGGSIGGELALCQRYYTRFGGTLYMAIGTGVYVTSTVCRIYIPLPVFMRTAPTLSNSTASDFGIFNGSGNDQASGLSANSLDVNSAALDITVTSRTAGNGGILNTRTNTSAFIAFSSEL
jgi:hypothetical protein